MADVHQVGNREGTVARRSRRAGDGPQALRVAPSAAVTSSRARMVYLMDGRVGPGGLVVEYTRGADRRGTAAFRL